MSETTAGCSKIKIWESPTKGTEVSLPMTYRPSQVPEYIYAEGISASDSARDVELALEFEVGGKVIHDEVKLTVVQVDLDISGVADADEKSTGGFISYNDNDSDDDSLTDKDDGTVNVEVDLVGIHINISPSLTTGQVKLEATSGSSEVDIWDGTDKGPGHHISLPKTWNLSTESLPGSAWGVEGMNTSSSLRDVELKLSYIKDSSIIHSDIVKFTVIDVDWVEDTSQAYGFDSYTDPFYAQKSVKNSSSDTVKAQIEGTSLASSVYFLRTTGTSITVSPSQASDSPQTVTFTGIAEGFSVVWSKLNSLGPYGIYAAPIGVSAYNEDSYTLAVRVVHEDDDDIQVIAPGASGSSPTSICVSPGPNGKRETNKHGDDVYSGEYILVGPNKLCESVADNTDDMSTDPYTAAILQNYLNNIVYNQSVVNWTVTKLPDMTVNFDLDADGKLDVSLWTTAEMEIIINNCKNDNYDYNIFIVDNPSSNLAGIMYFNQRYGFVFADNASWDTQVTAHELGHGAFGLLHTASDTFNLMHPIEGSSKSRLRKNQWDIINLIR